MSVFNTIPKVETDEEIAHGEGSLCCPECGDVWLHHSEVTVYSRPVEDGPVTTTRVHTNASVHVLPQPGPGHSNPSSRREGVSIKFWCEHCYLDAELTIAQHKGQTFLQWRRAAR